MDIGRRRARRRLGVGLPLRLRSTGVTLSAGRRAETTLDATAEGVVGGAAAPWLRVLYSPDGDAPRGLVALGERGVAVGRDVDPPGVRVADPKLSRLHFRVSFGPRLPVHRLEDAGSSHGTWLGEAAIDARVLTPGSVFRAGDTVWLYDDGHPMRALEEMADRLAPTALTVLLQGETGTGKEVVARRLHEASGRGGDFVALNCATLGRELAGSELFGHVRGAFSGAEREHPGLFLAAAGGTLFLDEVADLPMDLQPALLRALQERRVRPVGATRERDVDVRVLAASHVDLEDAVARGTFRADLYARLADVVLAVPPLRSRIAEILPLWRRFAAAAGGSAQLSADAAEALCAWSWAYNVRGLQSLARTFAALSEPGAPLDLAFLRSRKPAMTARIDARGASATRAGPPIERDRLRALFVEHAGNVSAVARALDTTRKRVRRQAEAYGLSAGAYRPK